YFWRFLDFSSPRICAGARKFLPLYTETGGRTGTRVPARRMRDLFSFKLCSHGLRRCSSLVTCTPDRESSKRRHGSRSRSPSTCQTCARLLWVAATVWPKPCATTYERRAKGRHRTRPSSAGFNRSRICFLRTHSLSETAGKIVGQVRSARM